VGDMTLLLKEKKRKEKKKKKTYFFAGVSVRWKKVCRVDFKKFRRFLESPSERISYREEKG
jgi:hypothetical protein